MPLLTLSIFHTFSTVDFEQVIVWWVTDKIAKQYANNTIIRKSPSDGLQVTTVGRVQIKIKKLSQAITILGQHSIRKLCENV